jgi:hypothetical protein
MEFNADKPNGYDSYRLAMNKIKDPELFMFTAGGRILCRRCVGYSSRTNKQCNHPALKSSKQSRCKWHGGASTGPKTKEGLQKLKDAHSIHGEFTKEAIEDRSHKNAVFRYLADLGNHAGLFIEKVVLSGRPPAEYEKLDLNNPDELAEAIKRSR